MKNGDIVYRLDGDGEVIEEVKVLDFHPPGMDRLARVCAINRPQPKEFHISKSRLRPIFPHS